ncbi:hypothetical protein [Brevundimonas sp.]|uniref:hypothetical protein n=1 Tax=Brevundimonas sp. TaxID=1871086 RepID=UPI003A8F68D0
MSQFELFERPVEQRSIAPSVEGVRARLESLLASLRVADVMPLTDKQLRFWQTVVPQMTNWLPPEEKAAICVEFDGHVERLVRRAA